MPVTDVWIQHPTPEFLADPMFASLRRWMGLARVPDDIPLAFTLAALDVAKVDRALISAWWGPDGPLLANDDVAALTRAHPDRLIGIGSVDLRRPMAAVAEAQGASGHAAASSHRREAIRAYDASIAINRRMSREGVL